MINYFIGKIPFEIVYDRILPYYLDMTKVLRSPLSSSKGEDFTITMIKIHEERKKNLEANN